MRKTKLKAQKTEEPQKAKIYKTFTADIVTDEEAKALFKTAKQVVKCNMKGLDLNEARTITLKISTANPDRSKDVVFSDGVVLDNYKDNNVVAGFHKYDEPAVGRAVEVGVGDNYLVSRMEFTPEGMNPDADILHDLYKSGFQHAASIGFIPIDYERNEAGGYDFKKWELLEYSLVLVPDNPEALTILRSKGFDPDKIIADQKEFEEKGNTTKEAKEVAHEEQAQEPQENKEKPAEETKETPAEEHKDADNPEDPGYTDETKVADLTVAQLKNLVDECLDAEQDELENTDDDKSVNGVVTKDVSQVLYLANILDALSWVIYVFENNEVSQSSLDKLKQSLALVLEVVQEQAKLGEKAVDFSKFPVTKDSIKAVIKSGRTISASNEEHLKAACDHMDKAAERVKTVLSSVDEGRAPSNDQDENFNNNTVVPANDDGKSATPDNYLSKLGNYFKTTSEQQQSIARKQNQTLDLLKRIADIKQDPKN